MAEIRTVTTLCAKRDEITNSIRLYERQLEQARADLAHINAAIRIFDAAGDPKKMGRYIDVYRLFKRGEQMAICKAALAQGQMTTKDLAKAVMRAKGLDTSDTVLARGVAARLIHALRMQAKRGKIVLVEKRHGVSVWRLT